MDRNNKNNNNDDNVELRTLEEARLFSRRLMSLGYDEERASDVVVVQMQLMERTAVLARLEENPCEDQDESTSIAVGRTRGAILHDDVLLTYWQKFANAISSAASRPRGYIRLTLSHLQ